MKSALRYRNRTRRAFTLLELLVVLGIITILMSLLLPAIAGVRAQARWIQCEANLQQVGVHLVIYANTWRSAIFPPGLGDDVPRPQRWPVYVFDPPVWNPPVLKCPEDPLPPLDLSSSSLSPGEDHSYALNGHLAEEGIKWSTSVAGLSASDIVVMGEKVTTVPDYYMGARRYGGAWGTEYYRVVERFRHGLHLGSNYLYLDAHVANLSPAGVADGIDAWDVSPLDPNRK